MSKGVDEMITLSYRNNNIQHFRGLSTDCTSDEEINKQIRENSHTEPQNGDELYCMDNGETYLHDGENKKWLAQ